MLTDKQSMIAWANDISKILGNRCDVATQQSMDRAVDSLNAERFTIAVVGKAKRGKSTFINALLGRKDDLVAPVDRLPASSAISRFRWAAREKATVFFRGGGRQTIGFESIRDFVTEELNPENSKGVDIVEIEGPFQSLDHDYEVLDTPGAGSLHDYHDTLLHAFIPQSDAIVFLVSSRMPLDQDELDLLKKVKDADLSKIFFAINRIDESTEQDISSAVSHNSGLLSQIGINISTIHRISAKRAFQGDVEKSGISSLINEITAFVSRNKSQVLKTRFASKIGAAIGPVLQAIELEIANGTKTAAELDSEIAALELAIINTFNERKLAAREFSLGWRTAVDDYETSLNRTREKAVAAIIERIQTASLFDVSGLAKQLPTVLVETAEEHLIPIANAFETAAMKACEKLQADYPSMSLAESGSVVLTTREGSTAIAGLVGGTAAAAAGTSLVAAGTAAATSIAAANSAALAAASTTIAAPSAISTVLTLAGLEMLAPFATGTATVAAPTVLTATPMWVALAGPIGWTIAGLGVIAIPLSWRVSKLRMRDKMEDACKEQMYEAFDRMKTQRLPEIRGIGDRILEETEIQFDRRVSEIECALSTSKNKRPSESELSELRLLSQRVRNLLSEY